MFVETHRSLFWKSITYAFVLFFVTFPFTNYGTFLYGGTSTRALNLIVFSGVAGIAFGAWLLRKERKLSFAKSPAVLVLGLYFASLTLSGILGLSFPTTFWSVVTRTTGVWYLLSLGVFMSLLWAVSNEPKNHNRLILSIILSTGVYAVADLLSNEGLGLLFANYPYDAFTFGNTTFASMYIFGAFLLALYYVAQATKRKWWMYALPIVLVISPNTLNKQIWFGDFSAGLAGEARATSYAIVLSIVMLFGMWCVSKTKDVNIRTNVSYALFGGALLSIAFAFMSLLSPTGYVRELYLSVGTEARPLVWEMSSKAIGQRPFFGWGADNFERVFEHNYDNRLLQDTYGNEAWFDRAHNIEIDQLVDNGGVGTLLYFMVYIVLGFGLLQTMLKSSVRNDRVFAAALLTYFSLHIVELQTAFDTSISYPMLAFMFVSAAALIHKTSAENNKKLLITPNRSSTYGAVIVLIGFLSWSLIAGALPFARAQVVNGTVRTVGSTEKRIPYYSTLFASPVDVHAFLWRTSTDFQRGIAENPKVLEDPEKVKALAKEIVVFEEGYRAYLEKNPDHFRAHLNLADILIYQMLFEVNKLTEAQEVLDQAILLVPQSPQPYWMKSVAYVYMRKFDLARAYAQKGLALNPQIKQSQAIVKYVEDSIKTFPEIDLFFFTQI